MGWRIFLDRGGTFTDVVAEDARGRVHVEKLLSAPADGSDPLATATAGRVVDELRMGTTVATNALLERQGARVLLLTTKGFGDILEIASQERPDIFALQIHKRQLLHEAVAEIDERILVDGQIERPLDSGAVRQAASGFDHVAVLFMHSWINPAHELAAEVALKAAGVSHVTLSHRVAAQIGLVARGDTTMADAYLTPLLRASVARAAGAQRRVLCMQSSGGLTSAEHFSGKDAILSGPAGGVVACAEVARASGAEKLIGLDMGGTSTDVCRYDGSFERVYESVTAGVRLATPMLNIVTVAAGGGSILTEQDGRWRVGPASAGANPGPACYGRGGPATVTDANLVLGRLRPEFFPHLNLDVRAATERLAAFGEPRAAAQGFIAIAVDNMAAAIRRISVGRGYDPREYALCAFGGAGGQHACAVARELGMTKVILHPLAGVLSAYGIGLADVSHHAVTPLTTAGFDGAPVFPVEQARAALGDEPFEHIDVLRSIDVRYVGGHSTLNVPWGDDWRDAFALEHRQTFGFDRPGHGLEITAARVDAIGRVPGLPLPTKPGVAHVPEPFQAPGHGGDQAVYRRQDLSGGATFDGPALVVEDNATTVVEAGWTATIDDHGQLLLHDHGATAPQLSGQRDPVTLEVMSNLFMSMATQMGEHLRRVAHSTNIKERLDFSCALFDGAGQLVANAPHIPVHLGAMGETVRQLMADHDLQDGDAWLINDPYRGGSHLPDLTVVTPLFRDGRLACLVANRGHHADVGGSTPGSMPTDSTSLADEGALFSGQLLLRDGRLIEDEVRAVFDSAGTRDTDERMADLAAQVAANREGARLFQEVCDRHGTHIIAAWMDHVLDNGAEVMADVVSRLGSGQFADRLDDGSVVAVSITVNEGRALIDFSGTSPALRGNLNAPRAVTRAAVLYVFRTLAARDIPLNEGCARVLDIVIPEGSLLDPPSPHAVVGGNVETSQRVVDVLYGALGVLAAAQGTMNNLTFGDDSFGYYETVCGGAGAGFGFDGACAVHTHMTNTRITDPEVLEQRHPVVLRRFAVRRGSGGQGVWRGGDGVLRELEFTRPLTASLLAERRRHPPFGLHGGGSGQSGQQALTHRGVLLLTPGGGGYVPTQEQWAAMDGTLARQLFREQRWTGPTAGIAIHRPHAHLSVVASAEADEAETLLRKGRELLHRSAPGVSTLRHAGSNIELTTDLPAYVLRGNSGPGSSAKPSARLQPDSDHVYFLTLAARHDEAAPPLPMPHHSGADGRLLILDPQDH